MLDKEIQEILEEESEMQKCICCGLSFVQKSGEIICCECEKKLSTQEYNMLTGKVYENIRKNRRKQNLLSTMEY